MKPRFARVFALWIPFLVATSGLFLFAYWGIQQQYRQDANNPQIQMAEDGAAILDAGGVPAAVVPRTNPLSAGVPTVDITRNLAPWIAVFDSSGTPLESSASYGDKPLSLPPRVFDTSTWKARYAGWGIDLSVPDNETRFSWQPSPSARQAVVIVRANNGDFVVAGRALREVEDREATLTHGAAILWGATELGTLVALGILVAFGWL
ncbi:MAG TPA: hypothetical protein VMV50_03405 [Candidatus Paceibacterota bacterium]|nr:hypothetical protein [Candidatus Paceibacterota bacterium]